MRVLGTLGLLRDLINANRAALAGYFDIVDCGPMVPLVAQISKFKC